MASMAYDTIPVRDGGFTVEDLDEMPEDGRRYELVDGVLIVSPSPFPRHQVAGLTLYRLLSAACPLDRIVLAAPTDVRRGPRTSLVPDVFVVRRADLRLDAVYSAVPDLVVEVLDRAADPSTWG